MGTQDHGLPAGRRKEEGHSSQPGIYQYDNLPDTFRNQVIFIWDDAMGLYHVPSPNPYPNRRRESDPTYNNLFWDSVVDWLSRENGIPRLGLSERDSKKLCKQYLLEQNAENALRMIELTFSMMEKELKDMSCVERQQCRIRLTSDQAIRELNCRLQQHGIGYRYEGGQLIKIESEYFYQEVTMPALQLLVTEGFEGPAKEFLDAHEHFRQGRYDSAITKASNSLESTIKTIFEARQITYDKNWAAKNLIQKFFETGLIPGYLESYFENLKKCTSRASNGKKQREWPRCGGCSSRCPAVPGSIRHKFRGSEYSFPRQCPQVQSPRLTVNHKAAEIRRKVPVRRSEAA